MKNLEESHKGGFLVLYKIYSQHNRLKKSKPLRYSIYLNIIGTIIVFIFRRQIDSYELITSLCSNVIPILPSILGFTLTGYVLLIGFGSVDFVKSITCQDDCGYSFYQHISSVFAWNAIVQSITLIAIFIFSIIAEQRIEIIYANVVNSLVSVLMSILIFYSLFLIVRLVLNIFHFGQMVQLHYTEEHLTRVDKVKVE